MDKYWIWLSSVPGMNAVAFDRLINAFGSPQAVWTEKRSSLERFLPAALLNALLKVRSREWAETLFESLEKHHVTCITRTDEGYPSLLLEIYDPPPTLFVRGNCEFSSERNLAVVGTRRPTRDGRRAARELSRAIATQNVTIVSGLAMGIDAEAHRGALEAGGRTVAVLPCGTDNIVPRENADLAMEILENGGSLITEFPPGTRVYPSSYPIRNRIISGLCPASLIVEGGFKSGAMVTANLALEQSREVFAVPGSIYSETSHGPNSLIAAGAPLVENEWSILEPMGWASQSTTPKAAAPVISLSEEEELIVSPLRNEFMNIEELSEYTKIPYERLNFLLTMLELKGIIIKVTGNGYRAVQ